VGAKRSPRAMLATVAGPTGLVGLFAVLSELSWRRWGDMQIDSGRELYMAWALACGRTLYVDIFDKDGPLSPYLNALWFKLFGASIAVLAVCNLAILGVLVVLVYRTSLRLTDRLTATLCGATTLVVSGITEQKYVSIFNFVLPYSHQQTHGIVLGAFGVAALERWLGTRRVRFASGAGLCLGLVFLTKAELFMPIAVTSAVAWAMAVLGKERLVQPRRTAVAFLLGALVPPLVFWTGLSTRMPPRTAWEGILGNWRHLGAGILNDPFYRVNLGLDRPIENISAVLHATLLLSVASIVAIGIDRLGPRSHRVRRDVGLVGGLLVFNLLVAFVPTPIFWGAAGVLPFACAAALFGGAWWWRRASTDAEGRQGALALVLWSTWAGLLLGKLGLLPRFYDYGFALALAASVLAVALLVGGMPHWLRRTTGYGGDLFRALATGAVLALLLALAIYSSTGWARRTLSVGEGPDRLVVEPPPKDPRGEIMARGLTRLRELVPPGGTLAVLPEGALLNYWLRHSNSTPYLLFSPEEIAAAGGESVVRARFQATPPDVVVLISRFGGQFGVGIFGLDPAWGKLLIDWVRSAYKPVETIGGDPLAGDRFGLTIFRRVDRKG